MAWRHAITARRRTRTNDDSHVFTNETYRDSACTNERFLAAQPGGSPVTRSLRPLPRKHTGDEDLAGVDSIAAETEACMSDSISQFRPVGPFAQTGNWFKGNLHVHSTASDGDLTPPQVVAWYRSRGYHFLALTDHFVWSEAGMVATDFAVLDGIELDGIDSAKGEYHVVGLGLRQPPRLNAGKPLGLQAAIDRLQDAGALVMLAHPYWCGQMSADLLDLTGYFGLEVYNGGCEVDDAKGFSAVHWDDILAAGCRCWGLAVDDAHWRGGDQDAGLGWVWLKALSLAPADILGALERGSFYASCGPRILDLQFDAFRRQVRVHCSPSAAIDFVGNGKYSRRIMPRPGQTLSEATHQLRADQRYVRVACLGPQGRWAWSNPIFVDEPS
jgi:hypothetical protein